jgi:hypothetical protein
MNHSKMDHSSSEASDPLNRLLADGRLLRIDTRDTEFGFESRVMARIRRFEAEEASMGTSGIAWRLAPYFGVLALVVALWGWHGGRPECEAVILTEATRAASETLGGIFAWF